MRLSSVIQQFEADLRASDYPLLPSHYKALQALKQCRSEHSPLLRMDCQDCGHLHYVPHSCGHRHCPHCQHHESQQWIERQLQKQVPARYALITFTLPAEFRSLVWSHQRVMYTLMFRLVWETLQAFSRNDKQLQGTPGVTAVLHTHNRRLDYHPHIHVVMPMAAIHKNQRLWRTKDSQYLFSHKALAKVFRAKMLAGIRQENLGLPTRHPTQWVVDCRTVGQGRAAIKYLGRYLYRGVIQEKDILSVKHGKVTFRYRDSQSKNSPNPHRQRRPLPVAGRATCPATPLHTQPQLWLPASQFEKVAAVSATHSADQAATRAVKTAKTRHEMPLLWRRHGHRRDTA